MLCYTLSNYAIVERAMSHQICFCSGRRPTGMHTTAGSCFSSITTTTHTRSQAQQRTACQVCMIGKWVRTIRQTQTWPICRQQVPVCDHLLWPLSAAIHLAARKGSLQVLQFLLEEAGDDVNRASPGPHQKGMTALHVAAATGM